MKAATRSTSSPNTSGPAFQEALETLAHQVGIESDGRLSARRTPVIDALSKLADYYQESLKRTASAMRYLTDRQIDGPVIDEFRLGYSERRSYRARSSRSVSASPSTCSSARAYMKMRDGGEVYDIFRGRVVMPIRDMRGKVVGFGGRAIGKDALPKYINSPESPVFSKRSVLYGVDKAKKGDCRKGRGDHRRGILRPDRAPCGGREK